MTHFADRKPVHIDDTIRVAGHRIMRTRIGWLVKLGNAYVGESDMLTEAEDIARRNADRIEARRVEQETQDAERYFERQAEDASAERHANGRTWGMEAYEHAECVRCHDLNEFYGDGRRCKRHR